MNKIYDTPYRYLRRLFRNTRDSRAIDSINIRNIRNVYLFSFTAFVLDSFTLLLFSVTNQGSPGFWRTIISVGFCIVACATVALLSGRFKHRYKKEGEISHLKANVLVCSFYIILSAWAIIVDLMHYEAGEQMLTFYIVQFCFVCVIAMLPKSGSVLIVLAFAGLLLGTYIIDGAANVQVQNYIIFVVIAVLGNAVQYMMLRESEKNKTDIIELNQVLQQEVSIDELTKLKNRKALREDFYKHIGGFVHVVMIDVDEFKSYNDTYGHLIGDQVLGVVAEAIRESFADGDAYRYGGDEFLLILPEYSNKKFEEAIGRWQGILKTSCIENLPDFVSCSIGSEHCMLNTADDLRNAINIADKKLYISKKDKED